MLSFVHWRIVIFIVQANLLATISANHYTSNLPAGLNARVPSESGHDLSSPKRNNVSSAAITTSRETMSPTSMNCSASWDDWLSSAHSFSYGWATSFATFTYHNLTASVTTLCDGHPRIVGGRDGLKTTATGTTSTSTIFPSHGHNYNKTTPICTPVPRDQTLIHDYWQVWVPQTETHYSYAFQNSSSTSSSVQSQDCGVCTIWGGTVTYHHLMSLCEVDANLSFKVQLIYFPKTESVSRTLCYSQSVTPGTPTTCPLAPLQHPYSVTNPYLASPCPYITSNLTTAQNSRPYVVSDGQTFYHDRAYISFQTAIASNSCGYVGSRHPGSILELKSTEVHSIAGYHHEVRRLE